MSFASECGIPKGLGLLFRSTDGSEWHGFHLQEPYALIGTSARCNARLPDDDFDPCHAYLQYLNGRLFACDLTGLAGVHQDGSPITASWFAPETVLDIGRYQVRVAAIEDDQHAPAAQPFPSTSAKPTEVAVSFPCERGIEQRARSTADVLFIGQSPDCDFQANATGIAPFHCSLVRTDERLWVIDLGTGTSLNGELISHAMLDEESQLRIGSSEITVNWSGANPDRQPWSLDPSYTLIPARTKRNREVPSVATAASGTNGRDNLVPELVTDLEQSHRQAFEEARRMVREILLSHERMHRAQVHTMQRQHDHMAGIINDLVRSRGGPLPAPSQAVLPPAPRNTPAEADTDDRFDVSLELEADPEIKDAWLRGQLQTIDAHLKKNQQRGFTRFLRGLRRHEEDAFS